MYGIWVGHGGPKRRGGTGCVSGRVNGYVGGVFIDKLIDLSGHVFERCNATLPPLNPP